VKKTLCFLLFIPVLASAAGFYVQPEFWGKDGAHRSLRKDLQTLHAQGLLNRFEWKFFDGVGLRAGAVFPVPALKADLGFSGGYVFGPAFNYHTYTTAIPDFVRVGGRIRASFLRATVDASKDLSFSPRAGFVLRGGLGVANGIIKQHLSIDGAVLGVPFADSQSVSDSWTGFTWEIAPSFYWQIKNTRLEAGVFRVGLPNYQGSETRGFNSLDWAPWGFFVRAGF